MRASERPKADLGSSACSRSAAQTIGHREVGAICGSHRAISGRFIDGRSAVKVDAKSLALAIERRPHATAVSPATVWMSVDRLRLQVGRYCVKLPRARSAPNSASVAPNSASVSAREGAPMNVHAKVEIGHSVCPHDCPSTCALDVELLADGSIGRVHGAEDNSYTAGVICAKVARYAERIHHPDRLMHPLRRKGPKGSGQFERISWDDALDLTAEAMLAAERRYGPEAVWPYYYAGTMGLVMRDGINRLRHAKRYSRHVRHHLHDAGLDRLHRRHRQARRPRSARDGQVRPGGDLGHQPRQHAGQRDDARHARPQGARRQDRRHRHLPQRHHAAGRPGAVPAGPAPTARSPAPSCTCCSATATPTGRIWRSTPTARASWRRIWRRARPSGRAPSPA